MHLNAKDSLIHWYNVSRDRYYNARYPDELEHYKKCMIVATKKLELLNAGWLPEDIDKGSFILIEKWLKTA